MNQGWGVDLGWALPFVHTSPWPAVAAAWTSPLSVEIGGGEGWRQQDSSSNTCCFQPSLPLISEEVKPRPLLLPTKGMNTEWVLELDAAGGNQSGETVWTGVRGCSGAPMHVPAVPVILCRAMFLGIIHWSANCRSTLGVRLPDEGAWHRDKFGHLDLSSPPWSFLRIGNIHDSGKTFTNQFGLLFFSFN